MGGANVEHFEQEPNMLAEIEEENKSKVFPEEQAKPEMIEMTRGKQNEFFRPRRIVEERNSERLRLKKNAERIDANVQRLKTEGNETGKLKQIRL